MGRVLASFAALVLAWMAVPAAQTARSFSVRVSETMGINRNQYPVRATVPLPQGSITETGQARLRLKDADVPAQLTAMAKWPDGSIRTLDVDFNVSLAPSEAREYALEYGGAAAAPAAGRGLTVTDDAAAIGFSSVKLGKSGSPLVTSANYAKTELIGQGSNGLAVVDATGGRHDLSSAQNLTVEILKRGPLMVAVQYAGTLPIDAKYGVPFTLLVEMPNSKSWVKYSADITDSERRVKTVALETPLSLGAFPWVWDVGTGTDTYGSIRNAMDGMVFTQLIARTPPTASNWKVETRAQGELRPYEVGPGAVAKGWGHMVGSTAAVAYALEGFISTQGTQVVSFNGQGQASFSISAADGATAHRLRLYQHFVSTPVAIGAATSPASMVNPPSVTVK